jgi:hypothetical protein
LAKSGPWLNGFQLLRYLRMSSWEFLQVEGFHNETSSREDPVFGED